MNNQTKGSKIMKKNIIFTKSQIIIIVTIAFALIAAIVISTYLIITNLNKFKTPDNQTPATGGMSLIIDENAKLYTGNNPEDRGGAASGIKIPGYGTVTLPANTTDVKMILLNPEGNTCYFTFELIVKGESYFISNMIEPSMCIEDLKLTKPLKKGEYKAILKVRTYTMDENLTPLNNANVEFDLIVR